MRVGASVLRGRRPETTYLYEDTDHPDRITGTLGSPAFTEDDRFLLLGLAAYEATLCPGCGEPKHLVWHSHASLAWSTEDIVCHGCTARAGGTQAVFSRLATTLTEQDKAELPPFVWGETTTTPDSPKT